MKLSLCMIVRDNEKTIRPCLESINSWVDEMIVVDTGSKDDTTNIVQQYGAKLFHFPWCDDFSAARNVSLEHASGEWLFWMDSDDTITPECGKRLKELAYAQHDPRVMGYIMQVHCPGGDKSGIHEHTVVDHVKLFMNRADIRFEGRIHEQVMMPIRRLGGEIAWTDIYVTHSGSDRSEQAQKGKVERDLRILKKDLAERPSHPFVLFNFAMTYAESGEYSQAIDWCKKSIENSQPHESHVAKTYAYLANCYLQLEQNQQSLEVCQTARQLYPDDPELLFREAMTWQSLDNPQKAIECYQQLLLLGQQNKLKSTDPGITGFKCRFNLGVAYREAKMPDAAERSWRQVLDEHPSYLPAIRALADQLLLNNRVITASIEAEKWQSDEATNVEGMLLNAQIKSLKNDSGQANSLYKSCVHRNPNDPHVLEKCCKFYFENGDHEMTIDILERLIAIDEQNAAAYHNLGSILLQRNDKQKAAQLLEKSLELRPDYGPSQSLLELAKQA